jgi:ketosteroid isomerase-like protein
MEFLTMDDEQRRTVALEYFKRMDRGDSVIDLFDEHAEVYFPKWGMAVGKQEIGELFSALFGILSSIKHDVLYANIIQQGDYVVVEGTSQGSTKDGVQWHAGATHAGRWCDVFQIRDFKIQRCFVYLDPDYAGADTARYPWLQGDKPPRF